MVRLANVVTEGNDSGNIITKKELEALKSYKIFTLAQLLSYNCQKGNSSVSTDSVIQSIATNVATRYSSLLLVSPVERKTGHVYQISGECDVINSLLCREIFASLRSEALYISSTNLVEFKEATLLSSPYELLKVLSSLDKNLKRTVIIDDCINVLIPNTRDKISTGISHSIGYTMQSLAALNSWNFLISGSRNNSFKVYVDAEYNVSTYESDTRAITLSIKKDKTTILYDGEKNFETFSNCRESKLLAPLYK